MVIPRGQIMTKTEKAVELFQKGLNCAQAMLTVFGEPYGIDEQMARRLGRPLGGGLGRMGLTCGAITGATLVLGLARGTKQDEAEARAEVGPAVQEFIRRFQERHGSSLCRDLLGADMSTEAGATRVKEEKLVAQVCPGVMRDAADILSDILGRA
jgi:C_GCAxxG_C_C family probable redox protein